MGGVYLEVPPGGKFRATSFNSETSESSSARSLARYDVIPNLFPMISIHKYDVIPNLFPTHKYDVIPNLFPMISIHKYDVILNLLLSQSLYIRKYDVILKIQCNLC